MIKLEQGLVEILKGCLAKIQEAKVKNTVRPETLKDLFKKHLALKNPYWEINRDSQQLTKVGLIFKPQAVFIARGRPIYVGILFQTNKLILLLEEQYRRTENNTVEIAYDILFNHWATFEEQFTKAFVKALYLANGIKNAGNLTEIV